MEEKKTLKRVYNKAAKRTQKEAAPHNTAAPTKAVAVRNAKATLTTEQAQLGNLEQFIAQLLSIERQSECAAVKAAIWIGEALNVAKPLLRGGFGDWARDRFPQISPTSQHYYRRIAADFREKYADRLKMPDIRDRSSGQALVQMGLSRKADMCVDEYVGERSLTEILYVIGARVKPAAGGFRPDVTRAADFIRDKRPDLEGVRTEEWDAATIREFGAFEHAKGAPADEARLKYEAAKSSFDHALAKLADLINGSTPKYQRLSGTECAEVAKQLRAFADIVSRAGRRAQNAENSKI